MAIRFQRTALVAGVKGQEAMAFAADVSKYVTETLGLPTTWGLQVGGTFATLHWFSEYADMAELEAALLKITTDSGYQGRSPGQGQRPPSSKDAPRTQCIYMM